MRTGSRSLSAALCVFFAFAIANTKGFADEAIAPKPAEAPLAKSDDDALTKGREAVVLKAGETVEMGTLFWVSNCRSLLNGPLAVEVMEGPPEITVSVRAQNVIPRKFNCAKEISGGMLLFTAAKEIKARTEGRLTIRVKYPTVDGERQNGHEYNVVLFP